VFSSTETVLSTAGTKRQPSFAVHTITHNLVQNPAMVQSTVHSPSLTISYPFTGSAYTTVWAMYPGPSTCTQAFSPRVCHLQY